MFFMKPKSECSRERTATHEVGHWLNLRHIWGDGPCGADDFVADTPESDGSNFGCDLGSVSCGSEDMVQNYMDYSDDGCMNVFSQGQGDRMQALFAPGGTRAGILTSNGCLPAVPDFDLDASILSVNAPSGFSCSTEVNPSITLFNNGANLLTSATITYPRRAVVRSLNTGLQGESIFCSAVIVVALG